MAFVGDRTAKCSCGSLTAIARGEPAQVYACSCVECQHGTGSAFSYAAIFPEQAVTVAGAPILFRQRGDSGRLTESSFCPVCGVTVCFRARRCREWSASPSGVSPTRISQSPRASFGPRGGTAGSISVRIFPWWRRSQAELA
jgi:hypothetical protein